MKPARNPPTRFFKQFFFYLFFFLFRFDQINFVYTKYVDEKRNHRMRQLKTGSMWMGEWLNEMTSFCCAVGVDWESISWVSQAFHIHERRVNVILCSAEDENWAIVHSSLDRCRETETFAFPICVYWSVQHSILEANSGRSSRVYFYICMLRIGVCGGFYLCAVCLMPIISVIFALLLFTIHACCMSMDIRAQYHNQSICSNAALNSVHFH